jgi:hypothetical protein
MSTTTDIETLRAQLDALDAAQAEARHTAENRLAEAQEEYDAVIEPLDEARAPLQLALEAALRAQRDAEDKEREALATQRRMTLTPWRMSGVRGDYGNRYLNGQEAWYGNVAWLRLVCRKERSPEWQWEAQVRGIGDIEYGPQSNETPAADFAKHARDVDARLVALGYHIADDR